MTPAARERLIVALDVPTAEQALSLVRELRSVVSCFKIGLELFLVGKWTELVTEIGEGKIFLDLKLPADIPTTITRAVRVCAEHRIVKFLTLSSAGMPPEVIAAARAGRGESAHPMLLMVPFLSSLGRADFARLHEEEGEDFEAYLVRRCRTVLEAGCDGLIVSGEEIGLIRVEFPKAVIVSPGIRPAGHAQDDHKRSTTPGQAIELGADYLVVGRPICSEPTPEARRSRARAIIEEIETALSEKRTGSR